MTLLEIFDLRILQKLPKTFKFSFRIHSLHKKT